MSERVPDSWGRCSLQGRFGAASTLPLRSPFSPLWGKG
jgi:hypothetical protein